MTDLKERMDRLRLRRKAKVFRASIPIGMATPIPDKLINTVKDKDIKTFLDILKSLGLQQANGYWERK